MSVVRLDSVRQLRANQFRTYIDSLDKVDLMGEFLKLMNASTGKTYSLEQAQDVKYVIEKLLAQSSTEEFRFQLRRSLSILNREIALRSPSRPRLESSSEPTGRL